MNTTYFYHDKPLFGLDIGYNSVKVMQIEPGARHHLVRGYGIADFPAEAIKNGVIIDYPKIAEPIHQLFKNHLVGDITTRRVIISVPANRTYTRLLSLPKLAAADLKDLREVIQSEIEQYIPVSPESLYSDYEIATSTDKETEVVAMAAPKEIIDSYIQLADVLGLELIALETTTSAAGRLFTYTDHSTIPTVIIDFGAHSSDITVYDKNLVVTGTVEGGGDDFTKIIATALGVSLGEAQLIKSKYGLNVSKKQAEILTALGPTLQQIIRELRRMIRYYEERSGSKEKIGQIVTIGGGANIPGLSEYLIDALRLPVRMCDPWGSLRFSGLQPPHDAEKSIYATAAGLALLPPGKVFGS